MRLLRERKTATGIAQTRTVTNMTRWHTRGDSMKPKNIALTCWLACVLAALLWLSYVVLTLVSLAKEIQASEKNGWQEDIMLIEQLEMERILQLEQRLLEIEKLFSGAEELTITAYAPLDPAAVEGICYEGNPNVTASGEPPIPGVTVAMGPNIPFETYIWIEGIGIRRVNDRGGRIRDDCIDLVMATREEALKFGRQKRRVVVLDGIHADNGGVLAP